MTETRIENGWIITSRRARTSHRCCQCQGLILTGTRYSELKVAGGGVQPHPVRLHESCLDGFLRAQREKKEAQ